MRNDYERETQQNDVVGAEPNTLVAPSTPVEGLVEVFSRHRARLLAIAYRMLGSVIDAEDIVQETFIRWQQNSRDEIASPEAFLVTIVSRLCLDHLQSARLAREKYFGQWLPEPVVTGFEGDPYSNFQMDESLSMAFLLILERLTPMERAVFLLREIFDYEYPEIARILEQTESNCRQVLRRARQHVKQTQRRFDASPRQREELFQQFLHASAGGDMEGLLAIFSKDIVLYADGGGKSSAVPNPIFGADHVARFLFGARQKFLPDGLVRQAVQINGRPGLLTYFQGQPYSALSFEMDGEHIRNIFIVSNPDKLIGLPAMAS
jgi:RNA polymerase sigma-70 factor, ECF subfamily